MFGITHFKFARLKSTYTAAVRIPTWRMVTKQSTYFPNIRTKYTNIPLDQYCYRLALS